MTDIRLFEARISEEGISALHEMLGLTSQQIFSPAIEVENDFISSPNYSIQMKNRDWLIFEDTWLETPEERIDYHRISVYLSLKPKDINIRYDDKLGVDVLEFPLSSILIISPSPIVKINILEDSWSAPECKESVLYDKAIIFHRENGSRFSISAKDTIGDLLEFTKNEMRMQEFVDDCKCRVTIE
jgi:hypothetical protein